jgi:prepilin signal peptidase PulO-like enzyme (type II secretory pathway)
LALAFAAIAWQFSELVNLPFLLFYAAVLVLIVVIDVEHRWVMLSTIIPTGMIALAEAYYFPRVWFTDAERGGLYGFGIMVGLYVLGLIFAQAVSMLTGRRVGRTVLGFGDVYIGTLGGLLIGWNSLGFALIIMVLTGALAAIIFIVNKLVRTGRYRQYSAIPYGPYIVFGTAVMLYAPQLVDHFIRRLLNWPI